MSTVCIAQGAQTDGRRASKRPCTADNGAATRDQSDELSVPSSPLGAVIGRTGSSSAWGSSTEQFAFKNKLLEMVQREERGSSFPRTSSNVSAASTIGAPSSSDNSPRTLIRRCSASNDEGDCPSPRMLRSSSPPAQYLCSARRASCGNLTQLLMNHSNSFAVIPPHPSCNSPLPVRTSSGNDACSSSPRPSGTDAPATPRRSARRSLLPATEVDAADLALLTALPSSSCASPVPSFELAANSRFSEDEDADAPSRSRSLSASSTPASPASSSSAAASSSSSRARSRRSAQTFNTKRLQSSMESPGVCQWAESPGAAPSTLQRRASREEYNAVLGAMMLGKGLF